MHHQKIAHQVNMGKIFVDCNFRNDLTRWDSFQIGDKAALSRLNLPVIQPHQGAFIKDITASGGTLDKANSILTATTPRPR